MRNAICLTTIAVLMSLAVYGCHTKHAIPQVVISNNNELLAYPSRKPVKTVSHGFTKLVTIPMYDPADPNAVLIVRYDEKASIEGFSNILNYLNDRVLVVQAGKAHDVLICSWVEEEVVEIAESDPDANETREADDVPENEPAVFEVYLANGKIYSAASKPIKDLGLSYKAYLGTKPEQATAVVKVGPRERMSDFAGIVKQLSDLGCKEIMVAVLKDVVVESLSK